MKNTDLLAGLGALFALMAIGAVRVFAQQELVSQDLQMALGAFVVAALTRWRLGLRSKAAETPEVPAPSKTPTEDGDAQDSSEEAE